MIRATSPPPAGRIRKAVAQVVAEGSDVRRIREAIGRADTLAPAQRDRLASDELRDILQVLLDSRQTSGGKQMYKLRLAPSDVVVEPAED